MHVLKAVTTRGPRERLLKHSARRVVTIALLLLPAAAGAQSGGSRPTPAQAQALLQARPDVVAQLRQRLATGGLTKDQVHARLRAEGYPEDLLDAYLPGSTGEPVSPGDDVFRAVRALGIADSGDVAALQSMGARPRTRTELSATLSDTIRAARTAADSAQLIGAAADSGFTIFGLDLFRSSTSQFEANLAGPVDQNYRLNAGDRLVLILTGDVEASYTLDVTREGFVVIPQVGQLSVANLTLGQLDQVLASRLSRVYSGIRRDNGGSTRFSISVAKLRSNQVYVTGDAQRPGSYMISSAATALTALYAAGGPTTNGSLRNVRIMRGGRVIDSLDVYAYLLHGDASHDIRLETGDIVFVPVHGTRARIVGEVERPATYELRKGEQLSDLLRDAGGLRATASRTRVVIDRILPAESRTRTGGDRATVEVSGNTLAVDAGANIAVVDGDVVHVFPIASRVRNRIAVDGNVYQPGPQGFTPGMKLSDALRSAGGLQPDTYLGQVLITRLRSDSTRVQLRAMLRDTLGNVINDPPLQEDDQITVFSVSTFRPDRFVSIGGAVRNGGRYPYREGMTLRDLVLLAGGVLESAYLRDAEIARLPADRSAGRTATTVRVPLDSTYLFERKADGEYVGPPGLATASGGAPEVPLLPYDNVLILRQPGWELQRIVQLQGEVRYPGQYALLSKTERLSDIIKRAGGLTEEAYQDGIVFMRAQGGIGRVGVDLGAAMRSYESNDNLILRDGDNITVPPFNSVVTIRGAVNQPSTVAYAPGRDIDYYIEAAGGSSRNGDQDHAYVSQPSGKLESVHHRFLGSTTRPRPKPGSVVTVPEKDPADKRDFVALAGSIAQIVASLVAVAIAVRR